MTLGNGSSPTIITATLQSDSSYRLEARSAQRPPAVLFSSMNTIRQATSLRSPTPCWMRLTPTSTIISAADQRRGSDDGDERLPVQAVVRLRPVGQYRQPQQLGLPTPDPAAGLRLPAEVPAQYSPATGCRRTIPEIDRYTTATIRVRPHHDTLVPTNAPQPTSAETPTPTGVSGNGLTGGTIRTTITCQPFRSAILQDPHRRHGNFSWGPASPQQPG
jgi:hypothetical protein